MSAKTKKTVTVVTLGDLERKTSCDCGSPEKAPTSKPAKLELGKLSGFGKHCVVADDGEVVRCFRNKKVATKVARGFGPGFRVKTG